MEYRTMLSTLKGYPFFPCKVCQRKGFSGKDNDGCDHTVFERAREVYPGLMGAASDGRAALDHKGE